MAVDFAETLLFLFCHATGSCEEKAGSEEVDLRAAEI